jgi:sulfite reductase (ferredoxin)
VRLTAQQKFVVLDVEESSVEPLVAALHELGLEVRPSEFRRGTMACTGIEFCKLAIVETKANAASLVAELEDRLPTFDRPLSIHVNGCPNSCARIQVADIGLKGMLVTDAAGNQAEGFQVHLGGELGPEAGLGRKPRGLRVSAAELPDYVERVLGRYTEQRDGEETFGHWARRADEEALA